MSKINNSGKFNRYSGVYGLGELSKIGIQAIESKRDIMAQIPISKSNLWDMLKVNRVHKSVSPSIGGVARLARQEYIYRRYNKYFGDSVLDVGCSEAVLRDFFNGDYIGIDISGNPDLNIDLEKGTLPFKSNSFDCVVCSEVLEHLDNIHQIFDEIVRVSRRYIILSLPNNWRRTLGDLILGRSIRSEYGLPVEKPRDRHKWFFNCEEAENFVLYRSAKNNAKLVECEYVYNKGEIFDIRKYLFGKWKVDYPPLPNSQQQSSPILVKTTTLTIQCFESIIKNLLYRWRGDRVFNNIAVVMIWFVLEKSDERSSQINQVVERQE